MRHLMLSLFVVSLLFSMVGCHSNGYSGYSCSSGGCSSGGCSSGGCSSNGCSASGYRGHGICDCVIDDHCSTRAPWIRCGGSGHESIPAAMPTKLPEIKGGL